MDLTNVCIVLQSITAAANASFLSSSFCTVVEEEEEEDEYTREGGRTWTQKSE
jgi:hypothetical protein